MKHINLSKGRVAIVDDEDFDELSKSKWYFSGKYAVRETRVDGKRVNTYMHRVIFNDESAYEVDHANRDPLDNRKENLRACDRSQNAFNSSMRSDNTTGCKGVFRFNGKSIKKWRSQIQSYGRLVHIGLFHTKEEAIVAYNEAAKKYHGEFAYTNPV